jgi:hypothetical protein
MHRLTRVLQMPGAGGLAVAAVTIPLILLMPGARIWVVLVALCLYPLIDVPRILTRRSWWLGAMTSAIVWVVVFIGLVQIAEAVRPLRDDAMVFLFPFLLYPLALVISGFVRLEGRLRGRSRESGPRIAAISIASAFGLAVVVPLALEMIPMVTQKITGNSPRNWVYSGDGDVVSADPEHVVVKLSGKAPESFRLGPDTKFDFRGPGSPLVKIPAGPTWLNPGQRVGLEYVYRRGEAQAERVNVWIDRKGCAGDEKWTRPAGPPATQSIPSLTGTTWEGWLGDREAPGRHDESAFEFLGDNRLANSDGHWRQNGGAVLVEMNDCYAVYEGQIDGDEIKGQFSNEMGMRDTWTARRKRDSVPRSR